MGSKSLGSKSLGQQVCSEQSSAASARLLSDLDVADGHTGQGCARARLIQALARLLSEWRAAVATGASLRVSAALRASVEQLHARTGA